MQASPMAHTPTLADQVTRLYDIIAGYHATHLLEIGRDLGVWQAVTGSPGITSAQLAGVLQTDAFYTAVLCRTAFSFGLLEHEGDGWRMAPHFDEILGNPESTFNLAGAARIHLLLGQDYDGYTDHIRAGSIKPYQAHGDDFMDEVGIALKSLPRIFLDFVLPQLPDVLTMLDAGARMLDIGCGAGWALVQFAERFPDTRATGIDTEPYSIGLAERLIAGHGLQDRCSVQLRSAADLNETAIYDVATSFLVIHELEPGLKPAVFAAVARALKPGGAFLVFDEVYPETDEELRTMPKRFAALAQWYELTWGNRVNTRAELHDLCAAAGLEIADETDFSRFHILVATKPVENS